jgi:hypothetical protein
MALKYHTSTALGDVKILYILDLPQHSLHWSVREVQPGHIWNNFCLEETRGLIVGAFLRITPCCAHLGAVGNFVLVLSIDQCQRSTSLTVFSSNLIGICNMPDLCSNAGDAGSRQEYAELDAPCWVYSSAVRLFVKTSVNMAFSLAACPMTSILKYLDGSPGYIISLRLTCPGVKQNSTVPRMPASSARTEHSSRASRMIYTCGPQFVVPIYYLFLIGLQYCTVRQLMKALLR